MQQLSLHSPQSPPVGPTDLDCSLSSSSFRWILVSMLFLVAACAGLGYIAWRYRVPPLPYQAKTALPVPIEKGGQLLLRMPNGTLVGRVGLYADELTAYLRFQYLRDLQSLSGKQLLLRTQETPNGPQYLLLVVLKDDLLGQTRMLSDLQIAGYIDGFEMSSPPASEIAEWGTQTQLFAAAYQQPVRQRLLQLPRSKLTSAVATFILFKMRTDRRVRERIESVSDQSLTAEDARSFAADLIEVAGFYDIPLDMLLGIGAMENDYLDVRGDLQHSTWKRRPQPGDIVLKRRRGRVLVSNYSIGPWQITRETLRHVHLLFLQDKRDYNQLPERLRPPPVLDLDHVDTHVLTTYAGLLLRTLLDYFNGDVIQAQAAYNGGRKNPNLQYSEGVSLVAGYAHRVLSMAAGRKGNSVAETNLVVSKQPGPLSGIAFWNSNGDISPHVPGDEVTPRQIPAAHQ